jgi:hypothetical protein
MKSILFEVLAVSAALLWSVGPVAAAAPEEIAREKVLAAGPEWQEKYDQFQPESELVDALKAKLAGGDVRIDVYLGLWCPDSRNHVPPLIKILDRLGPTVMARYFSVARKTSKDIPYYVEDLKVERVPTFVFYRGKGEIGRIIENPKAGMLEDFMEIIFKE